MKNKAGVYNYAGELTYIEPMTKLEFYKKVKRTPSIPVLDAPGYYLKSTAKTKINKPFWVIDWLVEDIIEPTLRVVKHEK